MEHLSQRGCSNITSVLSQVPKALLEDSKKGKHKEKSESVDLSMAENWVIRKEVIKICKKAISKDFDTHVSFSIICMFYRLRVGTHRLAYVMAQRFLGRSKPSGRARLFSQHLFYTQGPGHVKSSSCCTRCRWLPRRSSL